MFNTFTGPSTRGKVYYMSSIGNIIFLAFLAACTALLGSRHSLLIPELVSSAVVVYTLLTFRKGSQELFFSSDAHLFYLPAVTLVLYLFLFTIPIPLGVLKHIAPEVYQYYTVLGVDTGYLSLNPYASLRGACWFSSMLVLLIVLRTMILTKGVHQQFTSIAQADPVAYTLRIFLLVVISCCSIAALLGYEVQSDLVSPTTSLNTSRISWPFGNSNYLALYASIGLVFLVSTLLSLPKQNYRKLDPTQSALISYLTDRNGLFAHLGIAFIGSALLLTVLLSGSRTGLFALGFVLFFGLVLGRSLFQEREGDESQKKPNSRLPTILIAIVVLSCAVLIPYSSGFLRISDSTEAQLRLSLYKASLDAFGPIDVFGVGIGSLRDYIPKFLDQEFGHYSVRTAHNDFIQFLIELGVLGVALISVCAFLIISTSLRAFRRSSSVAIRRAMYMNSLAILLFPLFSLAHNPFYIEGLSLFLCLLLGIQLRLADLALQEDTKRTVFY